MTSSEEESPPIILVVEDESRSLRLRTSALAEAGCTTIGVRSHDEAVRELRASPGVDMVLTDIHLADAPEDKSGVALARFIKKTYADLPVAGYSAVFGDEDLAGDREAFDHMWPKGRRGVIDEIVCICRERALEHRQRRAATAFEVHELLRRRYEGAHAEVDLMRELRLVGGERAPNESVLIDAGYRLKLVEMDRLANPTIVWLNTVAGGVEAEVYGQPALYAYGSSEEQAIAEVVSLMDLYWQDVAAEGIEATGPALSLTAFLTRKMGDKDLPG